MILLDDCSKDKSVDVLTEFAKDHRVAHFIVNERNSGSPFKQWKKGIDRANGEYIWIAESDDYCEPEFLERIWKLIQQSNEELGLVYTQSSDVYGNHKVINRIKWTSEFHPNIWKENFCLSGVDFIHHYLKVKNVIPNASAVVFKRSLIDQKCFSKKFLSMKMCGDWWFWSQIIQNTNVGFLAQNLNYFRDHKTVTRNHKTREIKKLRLYEESLIRRELSKMDILQTAEKKDLYQSWFSLHHRMSDILNPKFYKVVVDKGDYIGFFKSYLKYQLKKS